MAKRIAPPGLPYEAMLHDRPIRDLVEIRSRLCGYALGTSLPLPRRRGQIAMDGTGS